MFHSNPVLYCPMGTTLSNQKSDSDVYTALDYVQNLGILLG